MERRKIFCVFSIVLFRMRGSRSQANRKYDQDPVSNLCCIKNQVTLYSFLCSFIHPSWPTLSIEGRQTCMLGNAISTGKAVKSEWHLEEPKNAYGNYGLGGRQVERELNVVLRRVNSGTRLPVFKS